MEVKTGQKFSETQFYSVVKIAGNKVQLVNDNGENIVVDKNYIDKCLHSADSYTEEVKIGKTEMAETFINNSRVAMTVCFFKQVKEADVTIEILESIKDAKISEIEKAVKKGVKKAIIGEERVMVGRHYGAVDEFGRIHFVDMEIERDITKSYDNRMRLVDPRTIKYLIVNNVKYILK